MFLPALRPIFTPLSVNATGKMLGVFPSNISRDFKLLEIPSKEGIGLVPLYRVWALRTLMVLIPDEDRRVLAKMCRESLWVLLEKMESYGYEGSRERFVACYTHYINTGTCIREGGFNRAQPIGLKKATDKKRVAYGHYVNRNWVAKYFGVTPGTVSNYLRVMGFGARTKISKPIFLRLCRLYKIQQFWRTRFALYPRQKIGYYQENNYPFSRRFTIANAIALESESHAFALGLHQEYEVIKNLVTVDPSEFERLINVN